MTPNEAAELLRTVVQALWEKRRRPIPGSTVKAAMLALRPDFNEREVGHDSFAAFVANTPATAIKYRPGTDFLVAPAERAIELSGPDTPRIRSDIWQAFVRFPKPNEVRGYDRTSDSVINALGHAIPPTAIPIDPIPRQVQLDWRRDFLRSVEVNAEIAALADRLDAVGGLREFSEALRANAGLAQRWNQVFSDNVRAVVEKWANVNGVRFGTWLRGANPDDDVRAQIYAALDRVPVSDLLELKVPLQWLVRPRSRPSE